jgi:hypothetical protein
MAASPSNGRSPQTRFWLPSSEAHHGPSYAIQSQNPLIDAAPLSGTRSANSPRCGLSATEIHAKGTCDRSLAEIAAPAGVCRKLAQLTLRMAARDGLITVQRHPAIVDAAAQLKAQSFLIDGEAVICRDDGLSDFKALRGRRRDHDVTLVAFDLLELDGEDLRRAAD